MQKKYVDAVNSTFTERDNDADPMVEIRKARKKMAGKKLLVSGMGMSQVFEVGGPDGSLSKDYDE